MEAIQVERSEKEYSKATKWIASSSSIVMSSFGGAIIGGIPGAALGLTASIFDEYLISHNKTKKHYITESIFWSAATLLPAASLLSSTLHSEDSSLHVLYKVSAAVMGLVIPHFSYDFLNYRDKLDLPIASFQTINKFYDCNNILSFEELSAVKADFKENISKGFNRVNKDLRELYNNPFITTTARNIGYGLIGTLLNHFISWKLGRYAGDLFITAILDRKDVQATEIAKQALTILSIFFVRDTLDHFIEKKKYASTIDSYMGVVKNFSSILIDKENSQKILTDEKVREGLFLLPKDFFQLHFLGVYKLSPILFDSITALASIQKLALLSMLNKSPTLGLSPLIHLAPYLFSILPAQTVLEDMTKEAQDTQDEYRKIQSNAWTNRLNIIGHLDKINLRGAEEFARHKFYADLSKEYEFDLKVNRIMFKKDYYKKIQEIFNQAIDLAYLGSWAILKNLSLGDIYQLKKSVTDLISFLSSGLQYQMDNKNLLLSQKRVENFFNVIAKDFESDLKRTKNNEGKIIFKDYELCLGNEKLIYIDHFEFKSGKRYALTGKSGCGKSSLLVDLKMGSRGALSSRGEISLGSKNLKEPHMMFIDQNLYLPNDSTLLEVVYFPKLLENLNEKEIEELINLTLKLFDELDIDTFTHNLQQEAQEEALSSKLMSKEFKLSGGQSKKIAIIQAILMKPEILIMDETFTGLDKNSLLKVQKALNNYLPDTLILAVDHHAKENNHDNFYDARVHFDENGLKEISLDEPL